MTPDRPYSYAAIGLPRMQRAPLSLLLSLHLYTIMSHCCMLLTSLLPRSLCVSSSGRFPWIMVWPAAVVLAVSPCCDYTSSFIPPHHRCFVDLVALFCTCDIYCMSVRPGRWIPPLWLSLRFLPVFFPCKRVFWVVVPYPERGSKDRGCHTLYRL